MKKMKRGDIILDLLYQVYKDGQLGGEVGFGSFIENVAMKIIELIDNGTLKMTGVQKIPNEYLKVNHPIPSKSDTSH